MVSFQEGVEVVRLYMFFFSVCMFRILNFVFSVIYSFNLGYFFGDQLGFFYQIFVRQLIFGSYYFYEVLGVGRVLVFVDLLEVFVEVGFQVEVTCLVRIWVMVWVYKDEGFRKRICVVLVFFEGLWEYGRIFTG